MKELLCNPRLSNVHIFCKRPLLEHLVTEKGGEGHCIQCGRKGENPTEKLQKGH